MNKKVQLGIAIIFFLLLLFPLFAETTSLGVSTMTISGKVEPRNMFEINQLLGTNPGITDAIPLDSGDILVDAGGIGVKVGDWSVSSNSTANLKLLVSYGPFTFNDEEIPYEVNNGSDIILSGGVFAVLVRNGGIYPASDNNGAIYIKRTNDLSYPPSYAYETIIQFTLIPE
ncbi:MAG: hypothetical protein ACOXZ2_03525 [Sphaerochaetaceae bacterium]